MFYYIFFVLSIVSHGTSTWRNTRMHQLSPISLHPFKYVKTEIHSKILNDLFYMFSTCFVRLASSEPSVYCYMYFIFLLFASVLLKVCHFLRSRSKDIRNSARDTLTKILATLGPSYFKYIIKELRLSLQRGYQVISFFKTWRFGLVCRLSLV